MPIKEVAADLFYNRLFEIDPQIRPMFSGDMVEQGNKLMISLALVVNGLKQPENILSAVQDLGLKWSHLSGQYSGFAKVYRV